MNDGALGIQWHITSNCLSRCKHCYMFDENYQAQDCSFDDFYNMFLNVSNFCEKYNFTDNYSITGGSALLNPDCEKILNLLYSNNKTVGIMDSPEMVNDENEKILISNRVENYQISLDGLKDTHDSIRGTGSFSRTIDACRRLENSGFIPEIMYTATMENFNDLIPLCKFLIKALDSFKFCYDYAICIGNAASEKSIMPIEVFDNTMEEYYNFVSNYKNRSGQKIFSYKATKFNTLQVLKDNTSFSAKAPVSHISGCLVGWSSICILENGDVLPCRRMPIVLGNLKEESFENIFLQSPLLKKFRRYKKYLNGCKDCEYSPICRGCPAAQYALFGDCFARYPYCSHFKKSENESADYVHMLDMNSSNEEEIELIKKTLDNQLLSNPYVFMISNPNIVKAYAKIVQTNSKEEFLNNCSAWQKRFGISLQEYERRAIMKICLLKGLYFYPNAHAALRDSKV